MGNSRGEDAGYFHNDLRVYVPYPRQSKAKKRKVKFDYSQKALGTPF